MALSRSRTALGLALGLALAAAAPDARAEPDTRPRPLVVDQCAPDYEPGDPVRVVPLPGDMDVCGVSLVRRHGTAHLAVSLVEPAAPERGRFYRIEWVAGGCVRQVWWPVTRPQGRVARAYDTCDAAPPVPHVVSAGRTLTASVPAAFAAELGRLGVMTYVAGLVPEVDGPVAALRTFHLALRPSDVAGHPPR